MSYFESFWESNMPVFRLDLKVPHEAIAEEAKAIRHTMIERRTGEGHKGWKSICLHGMTAEAIKSPEEYGYQSERDVPYRWTEIADLCPITVEFLKTLPYRKFFRVRFMLVESGGCITRHRDRTTPRLGPINIAITNHPECQFHMYPYGEIPFRPGAAYMMNLVYEHWVVNNSPEDRYHIITHGVFDLPKLDHLLLTGQ